MPAQPRYLLASGLACAAFGFALDQMAKAAALAMADTLSRGIEVLPFFNLVLVRNSGISFGLLASDHSAGRWLLILLTGAITVGLIVWLLRTHSRLQASALGLIIGGALGNLVDRLRHGAVTDFLDFHALGYHWPAFNLADTLIFGGAALLLFTELRTQANRFAQPGDVQKGATAVTNDD